MRTKGNFRCLAVSSGLTSSVMSEVCAPRIVQRPSSRRYTRLRGSELAERSPLIQVVVPSREDIPKYAELKAEIQRTVSEINGRYGEPGWMPIHYLHRSLDRPELLAYYRAADIALVTPLKDGMNLVAKEYCAAELAMMGYSYSASSPGRHANFMEALCW
jgi:trehalose-6-phosphate synthase